MTTSKTYVCDTTVLIEDPHVFYKTAGQFVIPLVVMRELDGLKKSDDMNVAKAARQVSRTLDRIGSYADLTKGVELPAGTILKIVNTYDRVDALASDADNKVIGTALKLRRERAGDVVLVSTDGNMRIVARALGIKAEYLPDYGGEDQASVIERMQAAHTGPGREVRPGALRHPRIFVTLLLGTGVPIVAGQVLNVSDQVFEFLLYIGGFFFAAFFIGTVLGLFGGVALPYKKKSCDRPLDLDNFSESSSPNADLTRDGSLDF
jgi:rRNA maturation endonuclease Nob1